MIYQAYYVLREEQENGKVSTPEPEITQAVRERSITAARSLTETGDEKELIVWYDCIEDMKAVSADYPNHTLVLTSRNEASTEEWELVVKNGEVISDEML